MLTDQKGLALGCQVDLFEHALQTATRCYNDVIARTKAETPEQQAALTPAGLTVDDEELVVVALLHDIGETLSPINHGEVAAGILRPFISPRNYWILMHHEIFQLYYYGEAAGIFVLFSGAVAAVGRKRAYRLCMRLSILCKSS
jgi:predicted HD phosphohydrolase